MKLEQQLTSLELSKRLKELGVKQESFFSWNVQNETVGRWIEPQDEDFISSYTVAELGEMLPPTLSKPYDIELFVYDNPRRYGVEACDYLAEHKYAKRNVHTTLHENEAEARGLMLAYLIENKLLTP